VAERNKLICPPFLPGNCFRACRTVNLWSPERRPGVRVSGGARSVRRIKSGGRRIKSGGRRMNGAARAASDRSFPGPFFFSRRHSWAQSLFSSMLLRTALPSTFLAAVLEGYRNTTFKDDLAARHWSGYAPDPRRMRSSQRGRMARAVACLCPSNARSIPRFPVEYSPEYCFPAKKSGISRGPFICRRPFRTTISQIPRAPRTSQL
jgi:hypothetical protein